MNRGRRFGIRILAVAFGVFFAWTEVTQIWRDWGLAGRILSYTAFVPLQVGSALALFRARRRPDLPAGTRRALLFFGLSFLSMMIGSAILAAYTISAGDEPVVSIADLFYTLSYPLTAAGFLALPRRRQGTTPRSRQLLDAAALVLTSSILVAVHVGLRGNRTGFSQLIAVTDPILALVGLLAGNVAVAHGLPIPSRRAWLLLVVAQAINLLSDIIFQSLWATGYSGPNWALPLAVGVNLAMLWAGDWFARDPMPSAGVPAGPMLPFSPLPILLAIGGAGALLLVAVQGNAAAVRAVLVTLIVLNVVLMVREFFLLLDATRAARLEAERQGERRFEALVRRSNDLILVVDAEQSIRFASASIQRLLGASADEVVGRSLDALVHPADRARASELLTELLASRGETATVAIRVRHADGTWRRFEWSMANLLEEPSVGGLVLNCRDVTERSELEEQLRQAQKMEVVGQLAGGVAHDFNNLLTAVLAEVEFALEDLPPAAPLRSELENIRSAAQRGRALTSRLLGFSRPSGAEPRIVRVGERIAEFRPLMQRLLGESHRLELALDRSTGTARIDPDDLEHTLLNLVANARDAMPNHGILRIGVTDRVLERPLEPAVLSVPAGRYVVVEVADSGVGMDPATQALLFQPFFTTKSEGQGTGLGLAGVLAFLRRSNAGVTVWSRSGDGARFELWFPLVASSTETGASPSPAGRVIGSGTILLVEDDDIVRHATRRILTSGGYTVIEAPTAKEARRIASSEGNELDLVVTDVMMPGESGAALAQSLRGERPDLPVLFISGYPGEDLARLGLQFRDFELLRKPFTARELTERVRTAMAGRPAAAPPIARPGG